MSMLIPQLAAVDELAVTLDVYDIAAWVEGYWPAREGIIIPTEVFCM